jgi:Zn-dependent protease with chaperone function
LLLIVIDIFLLGVMYLFYSPTIHFGILIGIGVIIFGTLHGILKGLFVRQKRGNALAKSVKREQEPKLWQISDNVAKKVGTKPVDEIHISPESGIGVHLSGDFFTLIFGRTRRILTVGMPSIASLTIDEMKAILAHECGHFSNKDTSWNSVTFTMAGALENTLESIPKPLNYGSTNIFYTIIIALNPALWIVRAYKFLFLVFTSGFSRMREVLADKTAVEFFGYKNFSSGLRKIARNDYLFANYYVPELIGLLREQDRTFKNIFEFMDDNYKRFNKDLIQEIDESILKKEKKSIFNSHPPIKQRMVYARNFNTQYDNHSGKKEFKSIFSNWNKLTLEMSDLYAYYIKLFL